jgi:hypothetical protein
MATVNSNMERIPTETEDSEKGALFHQFMAQPEDMNLVKIKEIPTEKFNAFGLTLK